MAAAAGAVIYPSNCQVVSDAPPPRGLDARHNMQVDKERIIKQPLNRAREIPRVCHGSRERLRLYQRGHDRFSPRPLLRLFPRPALSTLALFGCFLYMEHAWSVGLTHVSTLDSSVRSVRYIAQPACRAVPPVGSTVLYTHKRTLSKSNRARNTQYTHTYALGTRM